MGCRRRAPQDQLIRIVRTPDGSLRSGRSLAGRGAWLCAGSPACLDLALRRKAFARALRGPVAPDAAAALAEHLRP
ncbi:MAG: YlxR family protein [Microthrixaceae bacterium]